VRPFLVIAAVAACNTEIVVAELEEVASLKAIPNRDLDLLFVIDNSGSMADKQARLAASFPRMMDVLAQLDGGLPNLHLAVVTSDLGTSGSNGAPPAPRVEPVGAGGCTGFGDDARFRTSPAMEGGFVVDLDDGAGGRERNYTGELRDLFGELARAGNTGCGFEQHLGAMRHALRNLFNPPGFLRPDANLAVVIIADEDDCSVSDPAFFGPSTPDDPLSSFRCTRHGLVCDEDLDSVGPKTSCAPRPGALVEDVQPFVDALLALKPDPRMIMTAAIVGDPEPVAVEQRVVNSQLQLALAHSCSYANDREVADPAVRLAAFLDAFPGRSTLTSICSEDLDAPLIEIGATAKRLIGDPCLDTSRLVDTSPDPGLQPACEVVDTRDSAPDAPSVLPSCADAASGADCFEIVSDAVACPASADHLRVRFRRSNVSDDTWTSVRCQTRP
jgi:hypothetical protein